MLNIRQEERENRIMNYPKFDDINIGDFINYSEVIAKKYHQIYVRDTTVSFPVVHANFIIIYKFTRERKMVFLSAFIIRRTQGR
jgi:hypothetical protein